MQLLFWYLQAAVGKRRLTQLHHLKQGCGEDMWPCTLRHKSLCSALPCSHCWPSWGGCSQSPRCLWPFLAKRHLRGKWVYQINDECEIIITLLCLLSHFNSMHIIDKWLYYLVLTLRLVKMQWLLIFLRKFMTQETVSCMMHSVTF